MSSRINVVSVRLFGLLTLLASPVFAETRYALLAGCNTYADGITPLTTSINDVQGVRDRVLCAAGGYWSSENVTLLADAQATYTAVRSKIQSAANTCVAGDVFFFMYSGHGAQDYDYEYYESICLYEADYGDWQLGADLALFDSGVKVVVMLDTCYSAGMFKAAMPYDQIRFQKFAERVMEAYRTAKQANTPLASKAALGSNVAFMTACNKFELSWIYDSDYSLYTRFVLDGISDKGNSDANLDGMLTLKELHDYAVPRVVSETQSEEVQTPQSYHPDVLDSLVVLGEPDTIRMETAAQSVSEGDGAVTVRLLREGNGLQSVSVDVLVLGETAVPGKDFVMPASATVTWGANDRAPKSVTVRLTDDALKENTETFWFICANAKRAVIQEARDACLVNLLDNEAGVAGTVQLAAASARVAESGGFASLTVTRTGGRDGAAQVKFRTLSGSAMEGSDFGGAHGVLTWGAGDAAPRTIQVPVYADEVWEDNETFAVELYDAEGALPGALRSATVTLANVGTTKAPGRLRIDPVALSACEADGVARVTVVREGGADGAVETKIATVAGTAKAGVNFVATNAVLRWAHGDAAAQVVDVRLLDDGAYKADQSFQLLLSGPKGGATVPAGGAKSVVTVRDALATLPLSGALDAGALAFAAGGTGGWYGQAGESADGTGAAQLYGASVPKGKDAWMQASVTGPGVLSFSWRLAAQTGDALVFLIGAAAKTNLVDQSGWQRVEGVSVPAGRQTLKWRFVKNAAVSNASDTAWVDQVAWTPDAARATLPVPAAGALLSSVPPQLAWKAAAGATNYNVYLGATVSAQDSLVGRPEGASWALGTLTTNTTFYWRVDSVSPAGRVTRGTVWSFKTPVGALAVVAVPAGQEATVGLPFEMALAVADGSPAATSYSIKGLPAGLTVSTVTGGISGRPAKSGTFQVTAAAKNAFGTGPVATFTLTVKALPTSMAGTYAGLVGINSDRLTEDFLAEKLRGAAQMTVSAAGAISGSLRLADGTYAFRGVFAKDALGYYYEASIKHKDGRVSVFQIWPYQDVALAQQGYRGLLFSDTERQELMLTRDGWAGNRSALAEYAGYYTVALPGQLAFSGATYPTGVGYVTVNLNASGVATLAGVMGDGTAWSGSATAYPAPDGNGLIVPLFASLYTGAGQVWGTLRIAPQATGKYDNTMESYAAAYVSDQSYVEDGGLLWVAKARSASRLYPDGFCLGLTVSGGYYNTGAMTHEARLSKAGHMLYLSFDTLSSWSDDPSVTVALSDSTVWLPSGAAANPCGTTLSINTATGLISGRFALTDLVSGKTVTRKVSYKGVLSPTQWTFGGTDYTAPAAGLFTVNGLSPTPTTSLIDALGVQLLWVPIF